MKRLKEKEIITENKSNLHFLENTVLKKKYSLEDFAEIIPGIVHVDNISEPEIDYLNHFGEGEFTNSFVEIRSEGSEFLKKFFEPEDMEIFSEPLIQMVEENDNSTVISFFQKVRLNNHADFSWLLTTTKILKARKEFISISQVLSGADSSTKAMTRLLDDNLYLRKNMNKFSQLTKREKQIVKLVAQGKSTKQIAEELYLSHHTISTHRKNINHKLGFKSIMDWERFVQAFDLQGFMFLS